MSGLSYHFVVLKAAREGWPVVSQIVKFVVRDEIAQRDRVMRENLDAMASRVGEMQAKLVKLESMGERVSGLAGLKPEDFRGLDKPDTSAPPVMGGGRGGPYVPIRSPSMDQLNAALTLLDENTDRHSDVFTLIESRLLETRLRSLLVPSSAPVNGPIGSGFGFRLDPFTGRGALHTGLDFPADVGVPIFAAAGGVVLSAEMHPAYGRTVEIDHGSGLVTRYAHASKILVAVGDLIRRGQKIAEVGSYRPLDRAASALRGPGRRRATGSGESSWRKRRRGAEPRKPPTSRHRAPAKPTEPTSALLRTSAPAEPRPRKRQSQLRVASRPQHRSPPPAKPRRPSLQNPTNDAR